VRKELTAYEFPQKGQSSVKGAKIMLIGMTVYETLSLMIAFALLMVSVTKKD